MKNFNKMYINYLMKNVQHDNLMNNLHYHKQHKKNFFLLLKNVYLFKKPHLHDNYSKLTSVTCPMLNINNFYSFLSKFSKF